MKGFRIKNIILNNLTLAFIFTLPFLFFSEFFIRKYTLKTEGPINLSIYRYFYYDDLNHDGNSDKIYLGLNELGTAFCKIFSPAHKGQFNLTGVFPDNFKSIFFADTDHDGFDEIFMLTVKDSFRVYMNVVNYQKEKISEFPVCEIGVPGKRDFSSAIRDFTDLDGDGEKEIVFVIDAGFALQPRAIFSLNPYSGKIKRTPLVGSKLGNFQYFDLDNDSIDELITVTFTYQNYDKTANFPYDDNWSRLFVFDRNLEFKFPPLQFTGIRSQVRAFPMFAGNENVLLVYLNIHGDDGVSDKLYIVDKQGKIINQKKREQGSDYASPEAHVMSIDNKILFQGEKGEIYQVKEDLSVKKIKTLKEFIGFSFRPVDLNSDGKNEILWYNSSTGEIKITDHRMKNPITFDVPGNFPLLLSPVFEQSRDNSWLLRNDTGHYRVTYSIHPLWNIRFLLWFLIFAFFWLLLVLLNKIQTYKISEKQRVQQEIKELQYQVITSRFSPHYTFNVLNSLSLHLYNREKPELYDYFHKFIRQLRYLYDDKNQITRSLKEELQFCSDYLDIQKIRFPGKFDYNINLQAGTDTYLNIPKMMLHIFVENAFKHGLRPYTAGGLISIDVKCTSIETLITISDNGIGRDAARAYAAENQGFSTGMGIKMLMEFLALYNRNSRMKIAFTIKDNIQNEKPEGTIVEISIE